MKEMMDGGQAYLGEHGTLQASTSQAVEHSDELKAQQEEKNVDKQETTVPVSLQSDVSWIVLIQPG